MIMSKEELSKAMRKTKREIVLKNLHKLLLEVKGYPEYEDCIDYAIDELERKPCEDCVSRVEVLKIYDEWFSTCDIADKKESPKAKINALSSVTTIRPKGRWRNVDTNMYACSKCSHVLTIDPLDNSILEMNTCPFCSTEMEGVEE